jgi:hypothetical protein
VRGLQHFFATRLDEKLCFTRRKPSLNNTASAGSWGSSSVDRARRSQRRGRRFDPDLLHQPPLFELCLGKPATEDVIQQRIYDPLGEGCRAEA